ncbi:hypothetical protein PYR66_09890 [Klebsiella aerogenes]|nr:hypothetical protein PYR66_09890 [Klebsiella aerogenes]
MKRIIAVTVICSSLLGCNQFNKKEVVNTPPDPIKNYKCSKTGTTFNKEIETEKMGQVYLSINTDNGVVVSSDGFNEHMEKNTENNYTLSSLVDGKTKTIASLTKQGRVAYLNHQPIQNYMYEYSCFEVK